MGTIGSINKIAKISLILLTASLLLPLLTYLLLALFLGTKSIWENSFLEYLLLSVMWIIPLTSFVLSFLISLFNFIINTPNRKFLSVHYYCFIASSLILGLILAIAIFDFRVRSIVSIFALFATLYALVTIVELITPIISVIYGKKAIAQNPEWSLQYKVNSIFCALALLAGILLLVFGSALTLSRIF
ncbi:MAG TPA: hypothetical protein VJI46_03845 [Candidatus Nanoarchaeia archaeon]|nr:hypothetical protein [Candidatus Nanoarchaeia archaeon]